MSEWPEQEWYVGADDQLRFRGGIPSINDALRGLKRAIKDDELARSSNHRLRVELNTLRAEFLRVEEERDKALSKAEAMRERGNNILDKADRYERQRDRARAAWDYWEAAYVDALEDIAEERDLACAEATDLSEELDIACAEATRLAEEHTYVFEFGPQMSYEFGGVLRMCGCTEEEIEGVYSHEFHLEEESMPTYKVEYGEMQDWGGYRWEFVKADKVMRSWMPGGIRSYAFYRGDDMVAEFPFVVSIVKVEEES